MPSAVDEMVASAVAAANDEMGEEDFGFDPSPLILIAIDLLTEWLGGCMKKATKSEVSAEIAAGGWRSRYMVRKAVKEAGNRKGVDMRSREREALEVGVRSQAVSVRLTDALDDIQTINHLMMI